jgi:hypothetical protein
VGKSGGAAYRQYHNVSVEVIDKMYVAARVLVSRKSADGNWLEERLARPGPFTEIGGTRSLEFDLKKNLSRSVRREAWLG